LKRRGTSILVLLGMLIFIFVSQSVVFGQTWAQNSAESQNTFPHAITVTLYVHGGGIDGPALRAVSVISNDGAGLGSEGITNSEGYITFKGTSGTWQFTISSDNCAKTESKSMYIGDSGKVDLYFSQIEGKCVATYAPGFFSRVLSEAGIPYSDFAYNALENWATCEFTNAMWNPLATTWTSGIDASLRSDFNSNGGYPVQNYLAEDTGIEATASTLKLTYYKSIVEMLKLKAFDDQGIRSGLETWGGSGYEDTLVSEWQKAYLANAPTTQGSENSNEWRYSGSAYIDTQNGYTVLTPNKTWQVGNIWLNQDIVSPFTVEFRYKAGGGTGADGLTLMFYKDKNYEPGNGGRLGFNAANDEGASGYGIEFDSWENPESCCRDPTARPHIALIKDSAANHLRWVEDPRTEDNQWHQVKVEVGARSIAVYVDGDQVITFEGDIDRNYGGLGFSAATGTYDNWHLIDDVRIST